MNSQLTDAVVESRAAQLRSRGVRLALALDRAAWHLGDSGQPPTAALMAEVAEYNQELRFLSRDCRDVCGLDPLATDRRLSLNDVAADWKSFQVREQALQVLKQVADLQHREQVEFPPLQQCQQTAYALREQLSRESTGDWLVVELGELTSGVHPLVSLLHLVGERETLSDADWDKHEDLVTQAFGRGLATAVARGKIIASESANVPTPVAVAPGEPNAQATTTDHQEPALKAVSTTAEILDSASILDAAPPAIEDSLDSTPSTPAETAGEPDGLIFETPAPPPRLSLDVSEELSIAAPAASPSSRSHQSGSAPVRSASLSADEQRLDRVATAVLKLIREERYDLAAQVLNTCGGDVPHARCPVSAALLRTIALSRRLCYPRGEVAARIEEELQSLAGPARELSQPEDRLGVGLLLRAACLPVSLLGASATATAILRSFAIEAGTSQLYNFCSRVAAFGDRLQGFAAELFQTSSDSESWLQEHDRLRQEAGDWMGAAPARAISYARSSPLFVHAHWTVTTRPAQRNPQLLDEWARWQETLLTVHRLLRPVRDGVSGERNFVKQEVMRIMGLLEASRETPARASGDLRSTIADNEAMRDVLREALEFAHRWLRLQSAAPQRSPTLPSQAVEELRSDLQDRADQVLVELQELARSYSGRWVSVGALACRSAVEFIQRLCTGRQTLPLQEPEIHHVLDGVLLKVPELELDSKWQSIADDRETRRRLLDYVQQDDTTWRDAFEMQCAQADHLATLRLLEMPVWQNDDERGVLKQLRSQRLEVCRRGIREELSDLMTEVHAAKDRTSELRPEAEEWLRRAEALLIAIPRQQTFARVRSQVDALRATWVRVEAGEVRRGASNTESPSVRLPGDSKVLSDNTSTITAGQESSPGDWVF